MLDRFVELCGQEETNVWKKDLAWSGSLGLGTSSAIKEIYYPS
jgi:hypothetical protein